MAPKKKKKKGSALKRAGKARKSKTHKGISKRVKGKKTIKKPQAKKKRMIKPGIMPEKSKIAVKKLKPIEPEPMEWPSFEPDAFTEMEQGMKNLANFMRVLPWIPSFFIFPLALIIAIVGIVLLSGQWTLLIYLLEALFASILVAIIVRYTIGRKIERKMGMGLF